MPTFAQQADLVLRVDIVNGTLTADGSDWDEDAFRFLQDALSVANTYLNDPENDGHLVEIWVAAGTYRPDQTKDNFPTFPLPDPYCGPYGDCDRELSFLMRSSVAIYGGFPPDPANYHGPNQPATFLDRDPVAYETILSGDLKADKVDATAVLDGFTIQGGVELRGAQPRFRDCVIALHEGAAVRCVDGSSVMFQRCTFAGLGCDAIVVDGASRLELLLCEPAALVNEAPARGKANVAACSMLLAVDRAAWDAMMNQRGE